jgi:energy-coupling factor transporter transmembrane protein EcfT
MGFGFNLFIALLILPLTIALLIIWLLTRRNFFIISLGVIWTTIFAFLIMGSLLHALLSKVTLKKEDFYGQYVIDRSYFPGKQADWQYETFRFEIKDNDSIYFYAAQKDDIAKVFKGTISTLKPYSSERLVLHMQQPTHHILTTNPTIYRDAWGFYLVFNSPKFNNVFFTKGKWEPIEH